MELPFGLKTPPYGWPKMSHAYIDFIRFAIKQDKFIQSFKKETGNDLMDLVGSPLSQMIDKETGHQKDQIETFIKWLTENHWGESQDEDEKYKLKDNILYLKNEDGSLEKVLEFLPISQEEATATYNNMVKKNMLPASYKESV